MLAASSHVFLSSEPKNLSQTLVFVGPCSISPEFLLLATVEAW